MKKPFAVLAWGLGAKVAFEEARKEALRDGLYGEAGAISRKFSFQTVSLPHMPRNFPPRQYALALLEGQRVPGLSPQLQRAAAQVVGDEISPARHIQLGPNVHLFFGYA